MNLEEIKRFIPEENSFINELTSTRYTLKNVQVLNNDVIIGSVVDKDSDISADNVRFKIKFDYDAAFNKLDEIIDDIGVDDIQDELIELELVEADPEIQELREFHSVEQAQEFMNQTYPDLDLIVHHKVAVATGYFVVECVGKKLIKSFHVSVLSDPNKFNLCDKPLRSYNKTLKQAKAALKMHKGCNLDITSWHGEKYYCRVKCGKDVVIVPGTKILRGADSLK